MNAAPDLFISAGEVSGDLHGGRLLAALRLRHPSLTAFGIGGESLRAAGQEQIADVGELSLVGVAEVLPRLFSVYRLLARAKSLLTSRRPPVVLLIDSPDFNLHLARHARRLGLKVVYFIGPTLWAWRRGRIRVIRDNVDRMLTILPFEEEMYRRGGVRATYVGHPLLDDAGNTGPGGDFLPELGILPGETVVSVLPGSRGGEIRRLLPLQIAACRILARRTPAPRFLFPAASLEHAALMETGVRSLLPGAAVVRGRAADCLAASRAAIVASGTATLEAALRGTPFVTVYRLSTLSYLLGRALVRTPWISLPNIILNESIVEELIQNDCRPETIAASLSRLLDDEEAVGRMRRNFLALREKLGPAGAIERAADAVAESFDPSRPGNRQGGINRS